MWTDHRLIPYVAVCFVTLGAAACEDVGGPDPEVVGSITLSAPVRQVAVGSTLQLAATVLNGTGALLGNPQVSWASSNRDVAAVSTSGLVTGVATGTSDITASSGGKSSFVRIEVVAPVCGTSSTVGTVAVGGSRTSTLTTSDCLLLEGPAAQGWRLSLATQTGVALEVSSGAFDALVAVTTDDLEFIGYNEDNGESTDALLPLVLPAGEYIVWAGSFSPAATGSYTLSVGTFEVRSCTDPVGSLAVGDSLGESLEMSDCMLDDGRLADPRTLSIESETTLQIDMRSGEIDSYLFVTDAAGELVAYDDDGGEFVDAMLVHTFAPGEYTVWATSYSPGYRGAYDLLVRTPASADGRVDDGPRGPKLDWRARDGEVRPWAARGR